MANTYTRPQIIDDINAHMRKCGGTNSDWYVGIAADARQRLFNDHSVDEHKDAWIFRMASSSEVARDVEQAYLDAGCDGGPGGGDDDTVYVYAYKKSARTDP